MIKLNKILRRLSIIATSTPTILLAVIFESRKHPWGYIFDTFFVSARRRNERSIYHLKKLFNTEFANGRFIIDFGKFKLSVPEKSLETPTVFHGIILLYLDLIYEDDCRFPIKALISEGKYEMRGVILNSNDVVLDIGANVGFFSLLAARKIGPNGRVIAFEPMLSVAEVIEASKKVSDIENIQVVSAAVGDAFAELKFENDAGFSGGSSWGGSGRELVNVRQRTIDEYVETEKLNQVNFIKMDIEGMERFAVAGAKETIRRFKPKLAICIYHLADDAEIIKNLIHSFNPDYQIFITSHKLFAW